jgi:hypothetical protein
MESNKPEQVFKAGAVRASVFQNAKTGANGDYTTYRVVIEKRYKDGEEWKSTNGFSAGIELPKAIVVMEKAYEYVALKNNSNED